MRYAGLGFLTDLRGQGLVGRGKLAHPSAGVAALVSREVGAEVFDMDLPDDAAEYTLRVQHWQSQPENDEQPGCDDDLGDDEGPDDEVG